MGNHTIDCEYCGKDTRGLSGVNGCFSENEAKNCYNYKKYNWKCPINYPNCSKNCGNYGCGN